MIKWGSNSESRKQ